MKTIKEKYERGVFRVVVLGVIFDPKEKKILIGKRKEDSYVPNLTWAFPGGSPEYGETLEQTIIREIKEEVNIEVANLGTIFARIPKEKDELLLIYYLCEKINGEEKPGDDFTEFKWGFSRRIRKLLHNLFPSSFKRIHFKSEIIL